MAAMPLYEMVETVVLSALGGAPSGKFGSAVRLPGTSTAYQVTLPGGEIFKAVCGRSGWEVTHNGFTGCDRDLLEAAYLALNP
jgi:hypothetical protein